MRDDGLGQEDRTLDVGIKVGGKQILGYFIQVCVNTQGGTVMEISAPFNRLRKNPKLDHRINLLVDKNLDLSSLAQLQGTLHQLRDVVDTCHTGFANRCLWAKRLDLLGNFLGPCSALYAGIVDYNIGSALSKLDGNGSSNSPVQCVQSVSGMTCIKREAVLP